MKRVIARIAILIVTSVAHTFLLGWLCVLSFMCNFGPLQGGDAMGSAPQNTRTNAFLGLIFEGTGWVLSLPGSLFTKPLNGFWWIANSLCWGLGVVALVELWRKRWLRTCQSKYDF